MFIVQHTPDSLAPAPDSAGEQTQQEGQHPTKDCPWPGVTNPMVAAPLALTGAAAGVDPTGAADGGRRIVKVCGMREAENIRAVEAAGADWMGFIFCEASPRHVAAVPAYLPVHCQRVGVFVDAGIATIAAMQAAFGLDIIQLHGHETPDFCAALRPALPEGTSLMKMLPVSSADDLGQTTAYDEVVDLYLLETKAKAAGMEHYGGSGQHFDWQLLCGYASDHPFILSGGIRPEDATELARLTHPKLLGFDLNSRFERQPALKDAEKIKTFIHTLQSGQ